MAASLFGFGWGLYHWIKASSQGVFASAGTVMIAVVPLVVGILLLLQAIVMDFQNAPDKVLEP
jgi:ABC-type phosphate transport system auxiliary subunit